MKKSVVANEPDRLKVISGQPGTALTYAMSWLKPNPH
jgi:hypothetical protein